MKTLLWLGNPFFVGLVRERLSCPETCEWLGDGQWNVIWHNPQYGELLTWQDCLRLAGGAPDVLVVADTSSPPFVLGVENFPCRTVLYAVDTHIHSWLPWYGQAFDACLVSLKDHMEFFRHKILPEDRLLWSPPYAYVPRPIGYSQYPSPRFTAEARPVPCVFVGSMNAVTMPLRHHFLEKLCQLVPQLRVISAPFPRYYPYSRIVVNICEHGDLNFRIFESMGSGAALVTPAMGNGLSDLFQSGKHLQTYDVAQFFSPDQPLAHDEIRDIGIQAAESAAPYIHELLSHEALRLSVARSGWQEVWRAHKPIYRAQALINHVQSLPPHVVEQRRAQADLIRNTCLKLPYLHWGEALPEPMRTAYIKAARGEI